MAWSATVPASPLPSSISERCPSSPKPVTSVAASTPASAMASAAARFSVVITSTAEATCASVARSRLMAVVVIPRPSGLVSTSVAPASTVELRISRSSSTKPVTAIPYFGSGSSIVWPPRMATPAAEATSAPPRRTSESNSRGRRSTGHPTRFSAIEGVAPIA